MYSCSYTFIHDLRIIFCLTFREEVRPTIFSITKSSEKIAILFNFIITPRFGFGNRKQEIIDILCDTIIKIQNESSYMGLLKKNRCE